VFNKHTVFNGKTKDLIDNLMHSTLEEIATCLKEEVSLYVTASLLLY
jgi:hypothetical protein